MSATTLTDYRTLGRSGLVVSPLALGTMTFGTPGWGSSDDESRAVFDAYVDAGGNFVDTADVYAKGRSEELVGRFVRERGLRDRVVLATKFGFNAAPPNPNAGGNGRKQVYRALEGSLRRLGTDHVDLYWLHVWDMVTPCDEVLQTLGDLVRAGRVRYFGLSDMPAWYATKMATLAAAQGVPGPVAVQVEYSLAERSVEREHVPSAVDGGMGVVPWSPLAGGLLAGKYARPEGAPNEAPNGAPNTSPPTGGAPAAGEGRLSGSNPFGSTKFTERNWRVVDALRAVAAEAGRPPAQVALAWVAGRPGVAAPILGARRVEQLRDNLASLEVALAPEQLAALDAASALEPAFPYGIFTPAVNRMVFGGAAVRGWR